MAHASQSKIPPEPVVADFLTLEIGSGLFHLVDKDKGAELLEQIKEMREKISQSMGFVFPKIRIIDNFLLRPNEYCIKIKNESFKGSIGELIYCNGAKAGKGLDILSARNQAIIIARHLSEIIIANEGLNNKQK